MRLEHVRFAATDGWKLAGLLFRPSPSDLAAVRNPLASSESAAIFLHGNGNASVFESVEKMHAYAQALTRQGIAFFPFNNRGACYIRKLKRDTQAGEEETMGGTAYEIIKDCVHDIDGAIEVLRGQGFRRFFLLGESTGANKIVVYEHLKNITAGNRRLPIEKIVLICGGDDSGIYYKNLGTERFHKLLALAKKNTARGKGGELVPTNQLSGIIISWASLADTIDPDGLYNIFPYVDYFEGLGLAKKPLFAEFAAITKPILAIYGERDEFCYGRVPKIIELLKKKSSSTAFTGVIVPDADHGFTGKQEVLAEKTASFLAEDHNAPRC